MEDVTRTELVELFDHVWARLQRRLEGLTDAELAWTPTSDDRIGIAWRLAHITDVLSEERCWTWLGAAAPARVAETVTDDATGAVAAVAVAYARWRVVLADVQRLDAPIGPVAGAYASATRLSFVLHIADEFVHHAADSAVTRPLPAEFFDPALAGSCTTDCSLDDHEHVPRHQTGASEHGRSAR